jgi:[lysine-biosynthesis-protein LysW]--L-2-aminoadipate ligase
MLTSAVLQDAGIPVPQTVIAFQTDTAIEAIEELGYPVVLKPLVGASGRLLARINDRDAAEAMLEHKATLGGYQHRVFFIQTLEDQVGPGIRCHVVGYETVTAVYRDSFAWTTNTAREEMASKCPITPEIDQLSRAAARAVGGGVIAVDLLETQDGRLLVSEVNHSPAFRDSSALSGVDIAAKIADHVLEVAVGRSGH